MNTSDEIPVLHLTGLRSGDRGALERIAREIGAAARGIGFFSVADHGIPQTLIDAVFAESADFSRFRMRRSISFQ